MEALAHAAGISTATVYRIEKGKVEPNDETRTALADALGLDEETLFSFRPDATEASDGRGKPHEPDTAAAKRSAGLAQTGA